MLNARVLKHFHWAKRSSADTPFPASTKGMGCLLHSSWSEEHLDGDLEESLYLLTQVLSVDYQQVHCQSPAIHRAQFENHWFRAIIE